MPYQGDVAASNPTGSVGVTRTTTQAPLDLGTGAGGLPVTRQTSVAGASGTPGATLPVDDLHQASTTIERGKADPAATAGAEGRLDAMNGVGGGGGGGADAAVAAGTANVDPADLAQDVRTEQQALNDLPERDPRA